MNPEQGEKALDILKERCGQMTFVSLYNRTVVQVIDIAWGRDMGVDYDHVTTNISPGREGLDFDFFLTSEIKQIRTEDGKILFESNSKAPSEMRRNQNQKSFWKRLWGKTG
jgi:hypothetical protein